MARLRLEGLGKSFGAEAPVVRGIDLTVEEGEFVTLVGPSGCGKTTLLNLIAGLLKPTQGHIYLGDRLVDHEGPKERNIAMVFQSYALYPHMTVAENLGFPLSVAGVKKPVIAAKVQAMADRLGLTNELSKKPKAISGGQRQRVALGRALIRDPALCLFDEPLSNLDVSLRTDMRGELRRLHRELGATFIYVTHDQAEAMTLSTRMVVLAEGVVQQVGAPLDVYRRPKNLHVAEFVGSPRMNLALPSLVGMEDEVRACVGPRDAWIGIRPEHVRADTAPGPRDAVRGELYNVEPLGHETWLTVLVGDKRWVVRAGPEFSAKTGTEVWLTLDRRELLFFDRATGQRLDVRP